MIGKRIVGCVYVHRAYADQFGESELKARSYLPDGFIYHIIKFNKPARTYTYIRCDDFDQAHEPTMGPSILVRPNGKTLAMQPALDQWIYHHKWMMVGPDYTGFDIAASKARSEKWQTIPGINKSKIGKKSYWEHNVLPLLNETP